MKQRRSSPVTCDENSQSRKDNVDKEDAGEDLIALEAKYLKGCHATNSNPAVSSVCQRKENDQTYGTYEVALSNWQNRQRTKSKDEKAYEIVEKNLDTETCYKTLSVSTRPKIWWEILSLNSVQS